MKPVTYRRNQVDGRRRGGMEMHRCLLLILTAIITTATLAACQSSSGIEDDLTTPPLNLPKAWNMAGGDATQSGYFDWKGPDSGAVSWVQNQASELTPVHETADGRLICTHRTGMTELDAQGRLSWQYETGYSFDHQSVKIMADGTIRFKGGDSELITLGVDGTLLSAIPLEKTLSSGITAWVSQCLWDDQGRPYVTYNRRDDADHYIEARSQDGSLRWGLTPAEGGRCYYLPVGDRLYIMNYESDLYAYSQDGQQLWQAHFAPLILAGVQVAADGSAYVCLVTDDDDRDYTLEYLDPDGNSVWQDDVSDNVLSRIGTDHLGINGELYVVMRGALHVFNPDGSSAQLAGGVAGFSGVSTTGVAFATTRGYSFYQDGPSCKCHVVTPDGLVETYTLNDMETCSGFAGHDRRLFKTWADGRIEALAFNSTTHSKWTYYPSRDKLGIVTGADGASDVVTDSDITTFLAEGGMHAAGPEYFRLPSDEYLRFSGYWPAAGLYMFRAPNALQAWDRDTGLSWQYETTDDDYIRKCLVHNNRVAVIHGNLLVLLDSAGNEVLSREFDDTRELRDVAINRSGNMYLRGSEGTIRALDQQGTQLWQLEPSPSNSYPDRIFAHPEILVGSSDRALYGISTTGNLDWSYYYAWRRKASADAAISAEGRIYVPVGLPPDWGISEGYETKTENELLCFNASGELLRRITGLGCINTQPVIDSRGIVYTLNDKGLLSAVDRSGVILWQTDLSQYMQSDLHDMLLAPSPAGGLICAHRDCVIGIGE